MKKFWAVVMITLLVISMIGCTTNPPVSATKSAASSAPEQSAKNRAVCRIQRAGRFQRTG